MNQFKPATFEQRWDTFVALNIRMDVYMDSPHFTNWLTNIISQKLLITGLSMQK